MTVVFEVHPERIESAPEVVQWLQRFAGECLREAHRLTAERVSGGTGRYARSFEAVLKPGSPPSLLFGNSSPIAIYVEEDTEPHVIEPVKKSALRWFDPPGGGGTSAVFATRVEHPGTKGKHIVRDAVSAAGDKLRES